MADLDPRTPDATDVITQARDVLAAAHRAIGTVANHHVGAGRYATDAYLADSALAAVRAALAARLRSVVTSRDSRQTAALSGLIMRVEHVHLALKDVLLAAQRTEIERAQGAVSRLRDAVSISALAERIPAEAYRMGFTRVLFSQIRQGTWIAQSAYAGDDRQMALAMIEAGSTHPRRLAGPLREGEMVRRGQPILVRDPQTDPRVHSELIAITKTAAYVAAPVFSWGQAIGLVHADRHTDDSGVREFDRDALGLFAEGLGIAFERNLMLERLGAMREAAEAHLRTTAALADDFTLEVMDIAGPAPSITEDLVTRSSRSPRPESHLLGDLTPRENEVLRALAVGKTNAQIATSLFVTEGTVKSHVKHILRKLGAGNRTEAVAKYHRAKNSAPGHPIPD